MAAIPVSIILKIAATATLALMTCVAWRVASGEDGQARLAEGRAAQEVSVILIF